MMSLRSSLCALAAWLYVLLCLSAQARGGELTVQPSRDGAYVIFPQPVAQRAGCAEVQGDAAHLPSLSWREPNILHLKAREGTPAGAPFTVRLKPGTLYQSGAPAAQEEAVVRFYPPRLGAISGVQLPQGCGAVIGNEENSNILLSPASGLRFLLTEQVEHWGLFGGVSYRKGRTVSAHAEPVTLRHGVNFSLLRQLCRHVSFASLRENTPLPGCLLVVPDEPLPENTRWLLRYTKNATAAADDERAWYQLGVLRSMRGLHTSLDKEKTSHGETDMTLHFSSPLRPAEAEKLFRSMTVRAGAANAAPNETLSAEAGAAVMRNGVLTRTLRLGERTICLSFLGRAEPKVFPELYGYDKNSGQWRYDNPSLCDAVRLRVQSELPCTLELVLPRGSAESVLGIGVEEDIIHRLSHGAQAPTADTTRMGWGARLFSLPHEGKHSVILTTGACAQVQVTPHYWSPAEVLAHRRVLAELMSKPCPSSPAYDNALEKARYRADLTEEPLEKDDDERRPYERARRRALETGHALAPMVAGVPEDRRVASADWPVDLDALAGGKAAPGLYLLHLRAVPQAPACAAAQALGLSEDAVAEEHDIWVQVTGLSLLSSDAVVTVHHLADGTLPAQAQLYRSDTRRSLELVNGFADPRALSEPDAGAWYVAQEGDDVCMARCFERREQASDGDESRLVGQMLSDRTHYRPGEDVHLFGLLRRVVGDASRVARDRLNLVVKKPDGSTLKELRIRPDAFGAFEASFTLPEGEEDVTGTYRCRVNTPSYDCDCDSVEVRSEVFRRDSFDIAFESDLPMICPQHYSCRIKARDYNGSPLAGAKVELRLRSDLALRGGRRDSSDDDEAGQNVLTATFRTDAAGCVQFSCPVSLPAAAERFSPECSIFAEVAVTNDRGEVKRATSVKQAFYADFRAECKGNRLYAFRSPEKAGDSRNLLLPRAQKLHAVLRGEKNELTRLPNGFVRLQSRESVLWSGDIVIPARAGNGVELPFYESFVKALPGSAVLELTGTDGAGRSYRSLHEMWFSRGNSMEDKPSTLALSHEEGTRFSVDAATGGDVCVLIQSRERMVSARRCLQAGKQELQLPETEVMTGNMRVFLLHPVRGEDGLYREAETARTAYFRSDAARALDVVMELPADGARPGSELTLSGRVARRADGKPAQARLLLFAVDKGMLSISSAPTELPNWEKIFTASLPEYPVPGALTLPKSFAATAESDTLEGLWRGECLRNGKWGFMRTDSSVGQGEDAASDWSIFDILMPFGQQQQQCTPEPSPAPCAPVMGSLKKRVYAGNCASADAAANELSPRIEKEGDDAAPAPRLREDFRPLAVWAAQLCTDREGRFETRFTLPDTLTTYEIFCVAAEKDGTAFGNRTEELEVNQPVMLTPGTPLFMSTGDRLLLPLTITNGTKQEDTWQVSLSTGAKQSIRLAPKSTGTLFFELAPQEEGECVLRWEARAASGTDAVEGRFPVRFPAPLLKETHRVVLSAGAGAVPECRPAALLSTDIASSVRGELVAELSANPLLHLAGCAEFVSEYPYGCTEQTASALLPWILYERLAPVCPQLAAVSPAEAKKRVEKSIEALFDRQQSDGGLSYWEGGRQSCFWASAHAALVLTYAAEQGHSVPRRAMRRLRAYLETERARLLKAGDDTAESPLVRYAAARVLGDSASVRKALLHEALRETEEGAPARSARGSLFLQNRREDVQFLLALQGARAERHSAFLAWMRSRARDSRHPSTWSSAWSLLALGEYLSELPSDKETCRVTLSDGRTLELGQGVTELPLAARGQKLGSVAELFRAAEGTAYVTIRAKAQPTRTDYAGCSDKGLKLTRRYEVQGANGSWHPASSFAVGDVVRVTLTCTKAAESLHYMVLEDYLPASMEAINPKVPSQAAGIDFAPWSPAFDNREYLADRVRGFCTRWEENKPVTMVYYARVKRAGTATAPPAQAQLMYEPQTYALTPNSTVTSREGK